MAKNSSKKNEDKLRQYLAKQKMPPASEKPALHNTKEGKDKKA